ncbi:transcription elongation factor Spt5 [Candidatus Bathyarchaeota archaeon]|nr:transcription elongation factor Spt5 [Candidatus Bathyarchaeota archaeon]
MTEEKSKVSAVIYAIRTTAGQERNVADIISARAAADKLPIKSILAPETLRGYIFIESPGAHYVEDAIAGIKHVKSRVPGIVNLSDVERYIVSKPVIEDLNIGDTVEIIGGPFKGMRAKITRIDKVKHDITLELLEATFTLPITVHADYVKLVEKASRAGTSGTETPK